MIGALTSFGLRYYHNFTFHSWQIMFLVFGLITIVVGALVILFLPNNPMTSRLSRDEKIWAIQRLRENQTGIENKHLKLHRHWNVSKIPDVAAKPHNHMLERP